VSFDVAAVQMGAEVYAFDHTIGRETGDKFIGEHAHFFDVGLTGVSKTTTTAVGKQLKTLQAMMEMLGHGTIDVLKIDIEGNEWAVLRQLLVDGAIGPGKCPPFKQLLMELHFWKEKKDRDIEESHRTHVNLLEMVAEAGFRVFVAEENWRHGKRKRIMDTEVYDCWEVGWTHDGSGC
jgi:hypothetical protein